MTNRWEGRIEYEVHPPDASVEHPLFLVLAHPHPLFGGTMHNKVVDQVYRRSVERGWGVLRFNFRGAGQSTGVHDHGQGETTDFLGLMATAVKDWIPHGHPVVLLGYSFGAWILERALQSLTVPIDRMILVAPPVGRYDFPTGPRKAVPTTIFAAENDELIPLKDTKAWFDTLPDPKDLKVIPKADHYFIGTTTQLIRSILSTLEGS